MIKIKQIVNYLEKEEVKFQFVGNMEDSIEGFSSLYNYKDNTITWCKNVEILDKEAQLHYKLLITPQFREGISDNCIITSTPKNVFFDVIENFFVVENELPDIGQGTYISPNVKLGKNVKIGHNCVLDGDINIGDNTIIFNNVNLLNRIEIGKNCVIQSGVVMGHDDYGYTVDENNNKTMIKHYGRVVLEDDVFIGPLCVINRGTIDDTVIGAGSKIDAFCNIAHNVEIGPKSSLISGASLYGSVKTGENAYIASALVKNQVKLGKNVTVGMGSVVLKDVEDDMTVIGMPAKPLQKK